MADDKPIGYTRRPFIFEQVTEELAVTCRRCHRVWREQVTHYGVFAGFARNYDYCSKCITPDDERPDTQSGESTQGDT